MRLVSATRILNEDDIVEAFVRHNATHLDHMLFLDNGSTDQTLEILKALKAEGFPITVFQNLAVSFDEIATNSWAYQIASQPLAAAWVVFLDADEFIAAPSPLREFLPGKASAARVDLVNYGQTAEDNPNEPIVPRRLRGRDPRPTNVEKLILRGGLGEKITVAAGNHGAFNAGVKIPASHLSEVTLAHYPRRSGAQIIQKMLAGWLKALAAGETALRNGHSAHYHSPYETLRDKPGELFRNHDYLAFEFTRGDVVDDPLNYLGTALRYTPPGDPEMKAISVFLHFTERLARQHGRLIDDSPQARALVEAWNAKKDFKF
jgi:glycosyltransferase involved in cell wall biosynthesis